jgi:hypothetical protein
MDEPIALWMLAGTLLAAGVVLIGLGRRQRAGTLRRNWIAGLRTSETMRSDEAWHAAHAATAGLVTAAGAIQLAAGVALVLIRPGDSISSALTLSAAGLTLALVVGAGVRGHRIAARINAGHPGPTE